MKTSVLLCMHVLKAYMCLLNDTSQYSSENPSDTSANAVFHCIEIQG